MCFPAPATATRTVLMDGEPSGEAELAITGDPDTDALPMPCNKPAGTTVDYALSPVTWTPSDLVVTQQPRFVIGVIIIVPAPIPYPDKQDIFSQPFGPPHVSSPTLTLDGDGSSVGFGDLLANNVNPTVESAGPFSGNEGAPVTFSAETTSACPITSYVWQFSNGTTSFGPHPQRAFGDDGVFDGQLTVTDMTDQRTPFIAHVPEFHARGLADRDKEVVQQARAMR